MLAARFSEDIKAIRSAPTYKTINDKYFAKYNIDVYGE